ncbi:rhodanese-like domain-containing protein [Candidatus Woesearchaeota archaeon]|nr:rhodanese-like domain-containing protein [Candidatus Woesearchaeota archaeon]
MHEITATELKQLIAAGEKLILLDTRTKIEHIAYKLQGSKLIPYDQIKERHEEIGAPKDAKILVYCRSGNRSAIAAKQLNLLGYTNVINLKGGLLEWDNGSD